MGGINIFLCYIFAKVPLIAKEGKKLELLEISLAIRGQTRINSIGFITYAASPAEISP